MNNPRILIIQTAFTGDVILATGMLESLHHNLPQAELYFLLRKGNEGLFQGHPYLKGLFIRDKKKGFLNGTLPLIREIRAKNFDYVINLQRFTGSGFITLLSGAKMTAGFDKNPLSTGFRKVVKHQFDGRHETERNHELLNALIPCPLYPQKLYPSVADYENIKPYQTEKYICMAPSSVWYTKRLPEEKWIHLMNALQGSAKLYLLGGPSDRAWCQTLIEKSTNKITVNLAGKLSYLESAALIAGASMNYVNDSAPLHMCSAMNAPVRAFFCSTVPEFGFTPQSDNNRIFDAGKLSCRPCGIHGFKECPKKHFACGQNIDLSEAIEDGINALR
jgi:ADP-heptose:LPS heptosyltransferase